MPAPVRSVQPIHPTSDSRVKHAYAEVDGVRLHYVIGEPKSGNPKGTVLCIHGFPDMWYTWRYQIPILLDLNLRVIAPDCLGYGGSSAPKYPDIFYSLKHNSDVLAAFLTSLNISRVTLLAHDWGSMIAWRFYNFHPSRVSHIISLCVPYDPPHPKSPYLDLQAVVKKLPNFRYQIALADPQTLKDMQEKDAIKRFLKAMYRGIGDGKGSKGGSINVDKDMMASVGDMERGWIVSEEELNWYVDTFHKTGMHGPLAYYKNRRQNWEDEQALHDPIVKVPVLFIGATRDAALPPSMALGQKRFIPDLTSKQVEASHWMVWEKTDEINGLLTEWFENVVLSSKAKL
ncbi:hypothetical protein H072_8033 [Dactylellina haptotyla CBS 200.50]|uniref:AB hydrolase-1 domain-containing protein n=1 Tax=Dactylellina haptotyla (strain CBS 200.50) TaxID=1284197 RepID=S8AAM9_DACHA|nr:hypothetical protein H072_8033 [Dactylellina haptotyla CBS 200.50]